MVFLKRTGYKIRLAVIIRKPLSKPFKDEQPRFKSISRGISLYDTIIIGGGIAGLQASIQLGRMQHKVLVIDMGAGRSTLCKSYHNVLGWPDGISGEELRRIGRLQAEKYGVRFVTDEAVEASKEGEVFTITTKPGSALAEKSLQAYTLLIATGVMDRFPDLPGLKECLGLTVYVCPDCDGYEVRNRKTVVMGAGDTGANMALTLRTFTSELVYVNHERKPVDPTLIAKLKENNIPCVEEPIQQVLTAVESEGALRGVRLTNGETIRGERGFIAFGGNEVRSSIAVRLGVERLENKHILTDPRSKMTNIPGVWAAGDVGVHSEQLTIAMGEGSQAAIWMHKELLRLKEKQKARGIAGLRLI